MSYSTTIADKGPIEFNSNQILELTERIIDLSSRKKNSDRLIVVIAGVPGSGKTTIASRVSEALNAKNLKTAVLPQDGFHYYRDELKKFDNPEEAFERRGAPFTFNSAAFLTIVKKLKDPSAREISIYAPSFDHSLKDPVEEDIEIKNDTRVILIEGNYVLLKDPVWSDIAKVADDTWYVQAASEEVRVSRIIRRHLAAGIASTEEEARARTLGSDQLNADYIIANSLTPNVIVRN